MRTFKISSLSNFQMCNTAFLAIPTKLYIAFTWLVLQLSLCLYVPFSYFSLPSTFVFPPLVTTNLFFVSMSLVFFKTDFIFRERGREGREREKHQCVVASRAPPTGDLACNQGMCPAWESNPLVHSLVLNPLSHTSQGYNLKVLFSLHM